MTEDALDQVACETGLVNGAMAAKKGLPTDNDTQIALARRSLGDFLRFASASERDAVRRYEQAWYEGHYRGFFAAVAAMHRPARIHEGAGGKILTLRRP